MVKKEEKFYIENAPFISSHMFHTKLIFISIVIQPSIDHVAYLAFSSGVFVLAPVRGSVSAMISAHKVPRFSTQPKVLSK